MTDKTDAKLLYKEESYAIQGAAFEIYKQFRNRHKEVVYLRAFVEYLRDKGLKVDKEKQIPIYFGNKKVGVYTPDVVVDDCIFVELKCKPQISKDDVNQFWHYLKSSNFKVGYLINFGRSNGVQIIRRVYDTARNENKLVRVGFALLFCVSLALPNLVRAAELKFSLIEQNNQFSVNLSLDTQNRDINAIEAHLQFDPAEFKIKDVNDGGSIVNLWIQKPAFSNNEGTLDFSGIIPAGYSGGSGKIASIVIAPEKTGVLRGFRVASAKILLNDGKGTADEVNVKNLGFRIENLGQESLNPESYILYSDDKQPPDSFVPEIARDPNIFDGKYFLVFAATDQLSGIDHYEVMEVPAVTEGKSFGSWQKAESPYLLKDQDLTSNIYVRAVDKAGNFRVVEIPAASQAPKQPAAKAAAFIAISSIVLILLGAFLLWRWRKRLRRS